MLKFLNEQPRTTFKGLLLATNVGWANLEVHVTFNSVSMRNGSSDIIITVEVFEGTTKKKKKNFSGHFPGAEFRPDQPESACKYFNSVSMKNWI